MAIILSELWCFQSLLQDKGLGNMWKCNSDVLLVRFYCVYKTDTETLMQFKLRCRLVLWACLMHCQYISSKYLDCLQILPINSTWKLSIEFAKSCTSTIPYKQIQKDLGIELICWLVKNMAQCWSNILTDGTYQNKKTKTDATTTPSRSNAISAGR